MLALALANAAKAGTTNVEFLKGAVEAIPLPPNTIDVVISNRVINLSTDKPAVSDVVADGMHSAIVRATKPTTAASPAE